jgi:hypothetical protein
MNYNRYVSGLSLSSPRKISSRIAQTERERNITSTVLEVPAPAQEEARTQVVQTKTERNITSTAVKEQEVLPAPPMVVPPPQILATARRERGEGGPHSQKRKAYFAAVSIANNLANACCAHATGSNNTAASNDAATSVAPIEAIVPTNTDTNTNASMLINISPSAGKEIIQSPQTTEAPVQEPVDKKRRRNGNTRHDKIFSVRHKELEDFKQEFGHANPPQSYSTGLYRWCHRKRTSKRTGTLPLNQEEALLAIGFNLHSKEYIMIKFAERYKQLVDFKEKNGHFKITNSFDKGFNIWAQHLRMSLRAYKEGTSPHMRLEPNQIQMMKDIGFDADMNYHKLEKVTTASASLEADTPATSSTQNEINLHQKPVKISMADIVTTTTPTEDHQTNDNCRIAADREPIQGIGADREPIQGTGGFRKNNDDIADKNVHSSEKNVNSNNRDGDAIDLPMKVLKKEQSSGSLDADTPTPSNIQSEARQANDNCIHGTGIWLLDHNNVNSDSGTCNNNANIHTDSADNVHHNESQIEEHKNTNYSLL